MFHAWLTYFGGRHDGKWNYLRDDQLLSQRVGDFIELPELPGDKPKQFESHHWQNFLLTKQRLEIVSEVIDAVGHGQLKERSRNGLCLSGPQAALNYLIASIAYARGWYLQYIPLCGQWGGLPSDNKRAKYFLQQFKCLNNGLPDLPTPETASDLSLQVELLEYLRNTTEIPALILLDEHNELYRVRRENNKQIQYKDDTYFGLFTNWTGLSGPRLYTIYSGSAHSAFEDNLPSGEITKLRFLRPFDKPEAVKLIEELQIPKKFKDQYSSSDIYNYVTGGVPRYISLLATTNKSTIPDWAEEMVNKTLQDVESTCTKVSQRHLDDFITFLGALLTGNKYTRVSPVWYDKGFLYKSAQQDLQIINPIVRAGLWEYYVRSLGIEIVNALGQTGSVIGSKLETAVWTGLSQAARTIHPFEIGSQGTLAPWSIPKVDRIIRFDSSTSPPERNPIVGDKCWMWVPISENHTGFDFILQDFEGKQIIFVQASKQKPQEHKDSRGFKVLKALKKPKNPTTNTDARNLVEKELEMVTQEKGWTVSYKDGFISATSQQREWSVKFLFITSVPENEVKKGSYEIKNMAIIGKEQLTQLGVFWRDSLL